MKFFLFRTTRCTRTNRKWPSNLRNWTMQMHCTAHCTYCTAQALATVKALPYRSRAKTLGGTNTWFWTMPFSSKSTLPTFKTRLFHHRPRVQDTLEEISSLCQTNPYSQSWLSQYSGPLWGQKIWCGVCKSDHRHVNVVKRRSFK